ncbi:MAG TPA: radical SAM protein [Nitrospirota bacterium]|nr:radical SAM protein [Nitrospirota bacterium]
MRKIVSKRTYKRCEAFIRDAWSAHACRTVHFETTSLCNLKCVMCPVSIPQKFTRVQRVLPLDMFKDVLNRCDTILSVGLNNWGEPLLHPQITDMIAFCEQKNLDTIFATNATLLTKDLSKELLSAGLSNIEFSVDGLDNTYKKIRNTSIDGVLQNITDFLEINKKFGDRTSTCIVCTVGEENEAEIELFRRKWQPLVDMVRFQPRINFEPAHRSTPCKELVRSHLVVLSDGRVVPCCADYSGSLLVGNVTQNSLQEIYNGDAMSQLREDHQKGVFSGACLFCHEFESDQTEKRF